MRIHLPSAVITGLMPVIPIQRVERSYGRDGRDKPGHDLRVSSPVTAATENRGLWSRQSVLRVRDRDQVGCDYPHRLLLAIACNDFLLRALALADHGVGLDRLRADTGRFLAGGRSGGGDLGGLLGLVVGLLVSGLAGRLHLRPGEFLRLLGGDDQVALALLEHALGLAQNHGPAIALLLAGAALVEGLPELERVRQRRIGLVAGERGCPVEALIAARIGEGQGFRAWAEGLAHLVRALTAARRGGQREE